MTIQLIDKTTECALVCLDPAVGPTRPWRIDLPAITDTERIGLLLVEAYDPYMNSAWNGSNLVSLGPLGTTNRFGAGSYLLGFYWQGTASPMTQSGEFYSAITVATAAVVKCWEVACSGGRVGIKGYANDFRFLDVSPKTLPLAYQYDTLINAGDLALCVAHNRIGDATADITTLPSGYTNEVPASPQRNFIGTKQYSSDARSQTATLVTNASTGVNDFSGSILLLTQAERPDLPFQSTSF